MRELANYSASRERRVITIDFTEGTETAVLALVAAVETCLDANDIPSVSIKLDGQTYLLASRG